ncbi:hypothetical protein [Defluviimonas sp. WL0075]|uniref:hypothetical protein n=1 Tax=Albidovulum sediminicola TaxID=2984331 RepID=UPI0021E85B82|nr:hypothetical protein [Defluviimonas sp. WL0075]
MSQDQPAQRQHGPIPGGERPGPGECARDHGQRRHAQPQPGKRGGQRAAKPVASERQKHLYRSVIAGPDGFRPRKE